MFFYSLTNLLFKKSINMHYLLLQKQTCPNTPNLKQDDNFFFFAKILDFLAII